MSVDSRRPGSPVSGWAPEQESGTPAGARGPGPSTVPGLAPAGGPLGDRLQALLAQAVDEQLAERRLVAEALSELGGRLEATSGAARDAQAELIDTLSNDLGRHSATLGRLVEAVHSLPAALAELRGELAQLEERVAGMGGPTAAENAAAVAPQVADRLAAALAPAVADAVRREVEPLVASIHGLAALPTPGVLDSGAEPPDVEGPAALPGEPAQSLPGEVEPGWAGQDGVAPGGGVEPAGGREIAGDAGSDVVAGTPAHGADAGQPRRRRWWSAADS